MSAKWLFDSFMTGKVSGRGTMIAQSYSTRRSKQLFPTFADSKLKPCPVTYEDLAEVVPSKPGAPYPDAGQSFDKTLQTAMMSTPAPQSLMQPEKGPNDAVVSASPALLSSKSTGNAPNSGTRASAAYRKSLASKPPDSVQMSGWQKYKDDQLLRNPGGGYYSDQGKVVENTGKKSIPWLIGRDISGVAGNIGNFFANVFMGSKIRYRDEKNQIRKTQQTVFWGPSGIFSGTWRAH